MPLVAVMRWLDMLAMNFLPAFVYDSALTALPSCSVPSLSGPAVMPAVPLLALHSHRNSRSSLPAAILSLACTGMNSILVGQVPILLALQLSLLGALDLDLVLVA